MSERMTADEAYRLMMARRTKLATELEEAREIEAERERRKPPAAPYCGSAFMWTGRLN